eukprot:5714810-Ditylum_brightwellii.AAC.1
MADAGGMGNRSSKRCCCKDGDFISEGVTAAVGVAAGASVGRVTAADVLKVSWDMWRRDVHKDRAVGEKDREFHEMFGCGFLVVPNIWGTLVTTGLKPKGSELKHLLLMLCFLKTYTRETTLSVLRDAVDEKTVRKWIGWDSRFKGNA